MSLARYLSKLAALVGSDGKVPTAGLGDSAVTAAKLHTTAVTDKLGYTPVNKAGDTMTGTLTTTKVVANDGTQRFVTGPATYSSAMFGPRVGNDSTCSVMYSWDNVSWNKFDSTASGFSLINNSGDVLWNANSATKDFTVYGNIYGQGAFWTTFTSSINANADRQAGVWGSYASSATNTPTNSGILWHGMTGSADGGQFWQDYGSATVYNRKRWGTGWGPWYALN